MAGVHDAAADLDGNIWIVYSRPSKVDLLSPGSTPRPAR